MKITFLGTSHGVPGADRQCSCAIIEVGNGVYFIDMGAPVVSELMKRNIEIDRVKAVFTTHVHGDHTCCLTDFILLCTWYFKTASFKTFLTEQRLKDAMAVMIDVTDGYKIDESRLPIEIYNENTVYLDENIKASFIPTKHLKTKDKWQPSYAILIEAEGKKVLFSGDLSYQMALHDFPTYALENKLDAFVCELAHFGIPQIKEYIDQLKTNALYFNHVFPCDKFSDIAALDGKYPFLVKAVDDGEEIIV